MTTSWAARSLPVSYYPPFRLHGTPIICRGGGKSIPLPKKFHRSAQSRQTWGMSAFWKKIQQGKLVNTINISQICWWNQNVWILVVNIFCVSKVSKYWELNCAINPYKTVGIKDQGCFSNKGCFQGDFQKAIWKVKGTLDQSYGGGWRLWAPRVRNGWFWIRGQGSSIYVWICIPIYIFLYLYLNVKGTLDLWYGDGRRLTPFWIRGQGSSIYDAACSVDEI